MGWTSQRAIYYYKNGAINRKAEIDQLFEENYKIIRSCLNGSTYYGALQDLSTGCVFGMVVLTHVDMKQEMNFYYKSIHENMGPAERKCPECILSLLSPTNETWTKQWREDCHIYNTKKEMLRAAPVGTKIQLAPEGNNLLLTKTILRGKSTPQWVNFDEYIKVRTDDIIRIGFNILEA